MVITPFDEESVDLAKECGADILKIASCSNTDWPLIEKIAQQDLPVIASTGGIDIDKNAKQSKFKIIRRNSLRCRQRYRFKW